MSENKAELQDELNAMQEVLEQLLPLSAGARARVILWIVLNLGLAADDVAWEALIDTAKQP